MLKLKDIIELIKTNRIWFQDEKEGYITDTHDKLCYVKFNVMEAEVLKIETLTENEMIITLQKYK